MKVLLVDNDAQRADAVVDVLSADSGLNVLRLAENEAPAGTVTSLLPDVILVDMARADRGALDGIRQMTTMRPCPDVLFPGSDALMDWMPTNGCGIRSWPGHVAFLMSPESRCEIWKEALYDQADQHWAAATGGQRPTCHRPIGRPVRE